MLDKILDIIMTILPFFGGRKKRQQMAQEVKRVQRTCEGTIRLPDGTARKGIERLLRPERPGEGDACGDIFLERQVVGSDGIAVRQQGVYPTQKTVRTHEDNQSNCRPLLRHPGGQELHRA